MGTTTKVQSSTAAASERFQSWFTDSPREDDPNRISSSNQPAAIGQTLTFENVRIDFPLRPYPAQVQMMRKIVHTLNESENALLESPTGSGKSLALLCAALAWRENEEKVVTERLIQSKGKALQEKVIEKKTVIENQSVVIDKENIEIEKVIEIGDTQSISVEEIIIQSTQGSLLKDDDFQDIPQNKRSLDNPNDPKNWKKKFKCNDDSIISVEEDSYEDFQKVTIKKSLVNDENTPPELQLKASPEELQNLKYQAFNKIPRIYVGSRTHKQITQLVKELKTKTKYRPRTTILGSREHLCIHPSVSKSNNKAEDCVDLLDKSSCSYAKRVHNVLSHRSMKNENRIWDIEDIVKVGKKTRGCPYYASRKLYEGAEVVFCPYNYIIDPIIRKILDINLKNSIVILDEAHNIEDSSRSAGSFEVDENVLLIISKELEQIIRIGIEVDSHGSLQLIIDQLRDWIISPEILYTTKEYESHYCHWTGADIISKLNDINITSFLFENRMKQAYQKAAAHAEIIRKETESQGLGEPIEHDDLSSQVQIHRRKCLSNSSLTVIQGIFMVLGLLFEEGKNHADDYQMVLSKRIDRSGNTGPTDRIKRRKKNDGGPDWSFKLSFKCLNPGVIFRDVTESTRSVILTSGTLSPLNTFASELETKFEGRLEANHVIHRSQVWAGAIPRGPNGVQLKGVFSNMESFQYQDDIGESLCQIVETVPFGVLCFMPSYNALDKLIQRWKTTGMHDRLLERKMIICEPRGSDKQEFESAIGRFYTQVDDVELDLDEHGRDGALFFAVFRGKVSEGIDFTDNYCRAVVTIGIPYPGVKDMDVKFKKEYNDWKKAHKSNSGILSSSEWYSAQAFRAINQALGRCIRHKNDWGAIIMLEERFGQGNLSQSLSKWVRNQFNVYHEFPFAISSLQDFVKEQIERTSKPTGETNSLANEESPPVPSEIQENQGTSVDAAALGTSSAIDSPANVASEVAHTLTEEVLPNQQNKPLETYPSLPEIVNNQRVPASSSNTLNIDNILRNSSNSSNVLTELPSIPKASADTISSFFPSKISASNTPLTYSASKLDLGQKLNIDIQMNEPLELQYPEHSFVKTQEPPISNKENIMFHPPPSIPKNNQQSYSHFPTKIPETTVSRNDLLNLQHSDRVKTHITCSLCRKPLLHGLLANLKPVIVKDLRLVSDNNDIKHKELVELCNPYIWKISESLVGGPIDIRLIPSQFEVILSVADGLCYRFIGCSCSTNTAIGFVICEATNPGVIQFKGRVFIWFTHVKVEREVEQQQHQENVFGEKMDIPSSQVPSMNDFFYSL